MEKKTDPQARHIASFWGQLLHQQGGSKKKPRDAVGKIVFLFLSQKRQLNLAERGEKFSGEKKTSFICLVLHLQRRTAFLCSVKSLSFP